MDTKTVLVTGGNRGMGKELCRQFSQLGYRVILTSRDEHKGKEVYQKFLKEGLKNLYFHQLDVTDDESITNLIHYLNENFPNGIDVLMNNAGYASRGVSIDEYVAKETLDINYFGLKKVTHAVLPLMRRNGRIVNMGSDSGLLKGEWSRKLKQKLLDANLSEEELDQFANEFIKAVALGVHTEEGWPSSSYAVSKALVHAFTRILQRDLDKKGKDIIVVCALPGWVRTRMGTVKAPLSVQEGVITPIWLATAPISEIQKGQCYKEKRVIGW